MGSSSVPWDQFETNARLFGAKTDYDEEFYTTKLDRSGAGYKKRERDADRMAAEILSVSVAWRGRSASLPRCSRVFLFLLENGHQPPPCRGAWPGDPWRRAQGRRGKVLGRHSRPERICSPWRSPLWWSCYACRCAQGHQGGRRRRRRPGCQDQRHADSDPLAHCSACGSGIGLDPSQRASSLPIPRPSVWHSLVCRPHHRPRHRVAGPRAAFWSFDGP